MSPSWKIVTGEHLAATVTVFRSHALTVPPVKLVNAIVTVFVDREYSKALGFAPTSAETLVLDQNKWRRESSATNALRKKQK